MSTTQTHKSACILCSINCGIEIEADHEKRQFVKITGDKDHPTSKGYICQKATRLNYYQNQERLTSPLRKKEDGTFEEISWDVAIKEIAEKLVQVRDTYGGTSIAYAGGGGQGNHLGQLYANAFRKVCQTPYIYSSIAQEKTGNFWVHGKMFGAQNVAYGEPIEDAEFGLIIGANPMQAHGLYRARRVIGEISRDKNRTLVVIDPRETETAKKADYFLQVKPGRDAWLMSAMLGIMIQEGLEDKEFIVEHTNGFEEMKPYFMNIPIEEYCEIAGVKSDLVKEVTRKMCAAKTVAVRSDLGIEMSLNSTLNAYLKRLLFILSGNFNKHGTNHLATWFMPIIGNSREGKEKPTMVTQTNDIAKLYPPNILSLEIDSDHPKRLRALFVDSSNPLLNWADTQAQRKAYKKLDILVVVDVAMTETAREADYVLPASNQFEKYEATFFKENMFHLRKPVFEPLEGTLDEPEIYTRLIRAMGALEGVNFSDLEQAALADQENPGKGIFQGAMMQAAFKIPGFNQMSPIALRESLGKTMEGGAAANAAFAWFGAQLYAQKYPKAIRQAGHEGKGAELGNILFEKIMNSPSGIVLSEHKYEDTWDLMKTPDKKVNVYIQELLENWLTKLPEVLETQNQLDQEYPFNLIAGERRTYNANAAIRNHDWVKSGLDGALKIHSKDAAKYNINEGDSVQLTSRAGQIKIVAHITDEVKPGVLSMPHGHGLNNGKGLSYKEIGAMPNILTTATYCDPLAKTPYHKNVRVRLEKVVEEQLH